MKDELISKVMDEVMKKMGASDATSAPAAACCNNGSANCNLTEFVGTAIGHTIGLVIANVDHQIHEKMDIDPKYRSIGIIGDRTRRWPSDLRRRRGGEGHQLRDREDRACPVIPRAAPATAP